MVVYNMNLGMLMFTMFASVHFYCAMAQTRFVVGDALGWTVPAGGAAIYTTWASPLTFMSGDILIFNFTDGEHNVAEVSATVYESCTFTNPATVVNSPASITLTTTGNHYYICTFTSHCQDGQKLAINVFPADNTVPTVTTPITPATPSILPTPPSKTPYPPTSSPDSSPSTPPSLTAAPPPPPTSGAPSFTTMVPAYILTMGLAILHY